MSGNAIKCNPIPSKVAPKIYDEIYQKVISRFKVDMIPLGSIGKKKDIQTNGDIDIAIRIESKDRLNEIVDTCFGDCEINHNTMYSITSFGYPYNIDDYKGIAQVDFMIVKDLDWANFRYHSPNYKNDESKYKGGARNCMLCDIVASIPVEGKKDEYFEDGITIKRHWKHTYNTEGIFIQLVDFCGKNGQPIKNGKKIKECEKLLTNDPKVAINFIFGDNGKIEDANSVESIWKAIHDPNKFKYGDDILEKIEEKVYKDKSLEEFGLDLTNDFPCNFYKS